MAKGKLRTARESEDAAKIREIIGVGPAEEVIITTPQFTRPKGDPAPAAPPADRAAFEALWDLPASALLELGLRRWGRQFEDDATGTESGPMLWLFPGEWYSKIPAGLPIVDINFRQETFVPSETDNDIRFGCLAFGILKEG
jgi:hypothetical protein